MIVKSKGVSLIEILVTVLILAVGMLGVAALQLSSISNNQSGYLRSQATSIGHDLAARIKASKMAFFGGNVTTADLIAAYTDTPYTCEAAVTSCEDNACTEAELRLYDKWQVCSMSRDELPEGQVFVANPSGNRLQIAVAWTPVDTREDLGQGSTDNFINARCAALNVADTKDCVIFEVIP